MGGEAEEGAAVQREEMEGDEGGVPDAVEGEDVAAEAAGPEGGNGEESAAVTAGHTQRADNDAGPANKKPLPVMPVWRKKRPTLLGSRVRGFLESNFDQANEAFESIDLNMDGKISMRELRAALALIDSTVEFSDEELHSAILIADYDSSGSVDVIEFMRAFGPHAVVKEEIQDGLNNIGRTADGKKLAYLSCNLSNVNINNIVLLRDFAHLRYLDVSNNMMSDLSPLGCLPYLLTLNASNNQLTSVLDFKPPLCLREANFSSNRIRAINSLAAHRFLEVLDLSNNRIMEISGVRDNVALRKLVLDNNNLNYITNLGNLPLRHLSLANNNLSAVNGYDTLDQHDMEIMSAFEESYDDMEQAFNAMDANVDGRLSAAEFKSGLNMLGIKCTQAMADHLVAKLDSRGDGWIDSCEFLGLFRRSKPSEDTDPGISELKDLVSINLSNNPIKSLEGLEGHKCMRSIDMSDTGVSVLADLQYLKQLPVLEELNLLNTLLFTHSKSLASSSCMRLQALYILGHPQGKCKINLLNRQLVTAEEMASAANFHNPKDRQFQDRKRDDSQDLPPVLFL